MKDYNSPEAREERASQEDPIIMYLIVHETLGMSIGKTAAQTAHASQMLTLQYFDLRDVSQAMQKELQNPADPVDVGKSFSSKYLDARPEAIKEQYAEIICKLSIMEEWLNSSFRKVVLGSDDKNWEKIKLEFKNQNMVLVIDMGLTEIASGSETCIGLWPMRKNQAPKIIKRLRVL